jgi:hypothetical protein
MKTRRQRTQRAYDCSGQREPLIAVPSRRDRNDQTTSSKGQEQRVEGPPAQAFALDYWDPRLVAIRDGIRQLLGSSDDRIDGKWTGITEERKTVIETAYQIIDIAVGTSKSGNPFHIRMVAEGLQSLSRINDENPRLKFVDEDLEVGNG